TKMSEFGPAGDNAGQWECPDLLELPVEGTKETQWVLILNRNPGAPAGGTGVRYLIGSFDGRQFTEGGSAGKKLWADYGKDFYATNSFNDMPKGDERRIWIGWTSNWLYAKDEPTVLWRGAQSVPRTLALRKVGSELRMVQAPVKELQGLRGEPFHLKDTTVGYATARFAKKGPKVETYEIEAELEPGSATEMGFHLRKGNGAETVVGIVPATNSVFVDRTESGEKGFSRSFSGRFSTGLDDTKRVKLHIFVDRSSIEVFANDGEKVLTNRIYPPPGSTGIEVYSIGGAGKVISLTVWPLGSIWGTAK
ncbi:MAG TPA: GH32 C-terminal domain-containing protein, partial [Candidatus Angelobacter sp.]|nr:GH32 C-terminal domain-containing protein [Candidatus Angelobacter sp.]